MGHTWKNGLQLENGVTYVKMGHSCKNGSHLEKWVVLGKMGHDGKIESLENWVTLGKNGSHSEKFVTLGKMGHTWRNGSRLEKWVTVATSIAGLFILCTWDLGGVSSFSRINAIFPENYIISASAWLKPPASLPPLVPSHWPPARTLMPQSLHKVNGRTLSSWRYESLGITNSIIKGSEKN